MRSRLVNNRNDLIFRSLFILYNKYARNNDLYLILNLLKYIGIEQGLIPIINKDVLYLYNTYFSKKGKSTREFYNQIINLAKNPKIQCPFCSGLGEPSELDHFLPKSVLGYYAIFPYNLIPICKDCNQKYKKGFYPTIKNEQLIHFYLDNDCFFNEQWLFAEIIIDNYDISLSTVRFYVNPPNHWSEDLKGKVRFHFEKFELDKRFSTRVGIDLGELIDEVIDAKKNNINPQDFISARLAIHRESYPENHWKKALYQAFEQQILNIWNYA